MTDDHILTHIQELRHRLLVAVLAWLGCSCLCYLAVEPLMAYLSQPLSAALGDHNAKRLIFTSLPEAFTTYIKLALWCGFLLAFPIIAAQLYRFIAPGLYRHEKQAILPFMIAAPCLFYAGAALAYYGIFPLAWQFFVSFEVSAAQTSGLPIELEAKISEYLMLVRGITLAFGLAFQLPLALMLLVRAGLLQRDTLKRGRRYAVVIMLTAAALLTPPDIISQLGLFTALYALYESAILVTGWMPLSQRDHAA